MSSPGREPMARGAIFPILGIVGGVVAGVAILLAILAFEEERGGFSLLNHFVSELGQVGVSPLAWLFNSVLIFSGALFIPFCIGLGAHVRNAWGFIGMAAGICAGIAVGAVGVFPMNDLSPHIFVAMWFFRLGLATALLFGVSFLVQGSDDIRVRKPAIVFSIITTAAYAAFLVIVSIKDVAKPDIFSPEALASRPAVWSIAIMEWAVFFSTILWFVGVAFMVKRTRPPEPGTPS